MATFGRLLLLVALVLLAAGCARNKAVQTVEVVKGDESSLWEFYITTGEQCLAFSSGWPGRSIWEVSPFNGAMPPGILDTKHSEVSFTVSAEVTEPLEFRAILPKLALPARRAVELAQAALKREEAVENVLTAEGVAALRAVSEGRMQVTFDLQPLYAVLARKLCRGADVYPAFRIGAGSFTEYGTADLALLPEGFLISWGRELGGEAAFYYDGSILKAAEHAEKDDPPSLAEAQQTCAASLAFFARLGRATNLFDRDEGDRIRAASGMLSEVQPVEAETRAWDYLGDLHEQMVQSAGLSPPRPWLNRQPPGDPRVVTHQTGSIKVHFTDYTDWDWGIILEGDLFTATLGQRPSGLDMGYINDDHRSLFVAPYALSDVPLARLDSPKLEQAVAAVSQMARQVLQSSGAKDKLNTECLEALAKLADRKITLMSETTFGTSLSEEVSAAGNQMMYFVSVPWKGLGFVHCRGVNTAVALDFMPPLTDIGPTQNIIYQVRLEGGELVLIITEGATATDALIGPEVKRAAASVGRMMEAGLSHVPDFAADTLKAFIDAVASRTEYDYVTEKSLGEIERLSVGAG